MGTSQLFTTDDLCGRLPTPMGIDWHIGDVIQKLRGRKHWNQRKLADTVGVNKNTIVRAEQGDPRIARETFQRIAIALGTTLAELERAAQNLEDAPTLHDVERASDARGSAPVLEHQPFPSAPIPDQGGTHGAPRPLVDVVDRLAELAQDLHRNCLAFANKLAESVSDLRSAAAATAGHSSGGPRPGGSPGGAERRVPRDPRVDPRRPDKAPSPVGRPKEKRRA